MADATKIAQAELDKAMRRDASGYRKEHSFIAVFEGSTLVAYIHIYVDKPCNLVYIMGTGVSDEKQAQGLGSYLGQLIINDPVLAPYVIAVSRSPCLCFLQLILFV